MEPEETKKDYGSGEGIVKWRQEKKDDENTRNGASMMDTEQVVHGWTQQQQNLQFPEEGPHGQLTELESTKKRRPQDCHVGVQEKG